MSQKGFATIFGLCLILAVALCAKSIQESETNYSYAAADYQAEFELQNAAVSGIYEAAELVRNGVKDLPPNPYYMITPARRAANQVELINRTINRADEKYRLKKIRLRVWGERLETDDQQIIHYEVTKYSPRKTYTKRGEESGYILFSVAESSNARMDGKIRRTAFAYVLSNDDWTIHFMEPKEKD